ncbi:hypothetical protein [Ramlibacter rhizophilus]|uniref:Uncharacterized protein n=1 Tax=Ramlibacter rhizophilus TaxID=1781167 RepID=A0A4Z0BJB7_9BURK|nr:hypothetical protein [Ramlibacter rhizophilus]TFY98503.1 hypothetical protein EZ242_13240 [Ramlibacter rhizophilus]
MDASGGERRYFTVRDAAGKDMPAVEYWAGYFEHEQVAHQVVPLRRFVKLLWSGEPLLEQGEGRFVGRVSGRVFMASAPGRPA